MMFGDAGWCIVPNSQAIAQWAAAARQASLAQIAKPEIRETWLQCQGTWFVGVDLLDNDADGAVGGVALPATLANKFAGPFHRAQVSVIYPGYPKPRGGESEAAFRYRLRRDAAHVDGILAIGPARRRYLREPHAYVLGIPLTQVSDGASPMVVWDGSHRIMRDAFARAYAGIDPQDWAQVDVTEIYQETRRYVFDHCARRVLHVPLGAAYAIHPLALHGVAPWQEGATAPQEGRMIAYFRPHLANVAEWLTI